MAAITTFLRPRRWPLLMSLCSLALVVLGTVSSTARLGRGFPGFWVVDFGFLPNLGSLGWDIRAADLAHSAVLEANGIAVERGAEIYRLAESLPIGTEVEYRFVRRGEEIVRRIPTRQFAASDHVRMYAPFLVGAWVLWGIGTLVGLSRPRGRAAQALARATLIDAAATASTVHLLHADPFLTKLWAVLDYAGMGAMVHLALIFPVESRWLRHRWQVALLYVPGLALLLPIGLGVYQRPPDLRPILFAYVVFSVVGLAVFARVVAAYWRDQQGARARLRAMLPLFLGAALAALGIETTAWISQTRLSFQLTYALLPIALGAVAYVILRDDLSDVDRHLRRTLIHGLAAVLAFCVFAITMQAIRVLSPPTLQPREVAIAGIVVVLLGWCLVPLRARVQRLLEGFFLEDPSSQVAALRSAGRELPALVEVQAIAERVVAVLQSCHGVSVAGVVLMQPYVASPRLVAGDSRMGADAAEVPERLAQILSTGVSGRSEGDVAALLREIMRSEQAPLVFPMVAGAETDAGVLWVLLSDTRGVPDPRWLEAVAELSRRAALALRNANAYRSLEHLTQDLDAEVQARTTDLEQSNRDLEAAAARLSSMERQIVDADKMATLGQLVAGVVHDINTPASFVLNSLTTLQLHLERLVDAMRAYEALPLATAAQADKAALMSQLQIDHLLRRMPDLLRICNEGAERVAAIVEDLRTFSRLDRLPSTPLRLQSTIEDALAALQRRIHDLGVVVEPDYDTRVPNIEAVASQLVRLWRVLLDNALDAVEPRRGCIRITTRWLAESDAVEVQVSDNGRGISSGEQRRIFEPFFTTKPVGQGTGLGLAIVYGIVRAHGGSIEAMPTPGGGTTMTVRLTRQCSAASLPVVAGGSGA